MNRLDEIARGGQVQPPHLSKPGDPPNMLWPPAIRRLWLDGWCAGYWVGHAHGILEGRATFAARDAA